MSYMGAYIANTRNDTSGTSGDSDHKVYGLLDFCES